MITSFDPDQTFEFNPLTHKCDLPDLSYKNVEQGEINCTKCGGGWRLNPEKGWVRFPEVKTQRRFNK